MVDKTVYFATGNRKESTARVRMIPGSGKMLINGVTSETYLQYSPNYIRISTSPLSTLGLEKKYDIYVNAHGGGLTGQTEAIRLGLARALCKINPENRTALKFEGYLTRDSRKIERTCRKK
jgi:small subunit ribosomal protein S9